jgi:NTP pyrophosphatase (non-canonical NTP hydrolase)
MSSHIIEYNGLSAELTEFAEERDWEQFHSPKNLVMSLNTEVGELTEIFQWLSEVESYQIKDDPEKMQHVGQELADVLMNLVRLSDVLGVDLDAAVQDKLASTKEKYPAELVRGQHKKYDEL